MAKYLINDDEANALRKLVNKDQVLPKLGFDLKQHRGSGNFPFRFKLREAFGATTANKANADIYYLGDSTGTLITTTLITDDSSSFGSAVSGDIGLCIYSTEYNAVFMPYRVGSETEFMGLATTDYATTDSSVVIDNLESMNGIGTTLTQLTVNNRFAWNINNNADCYVKYNAHTSNYDLIQTRCT